MEPQPKTRAARLAHALLIALAIIAAIIAAPILLVKLLADAKGERR